MHSFHPSRGRVFFEVLCALVISASLVGAWIQTGATALLPAGSVAALYGLVHLFDMRRPKSAEAPKSFEAVLPQRIDFATDQQGELLADLDTVAPLADVDRAPATDHLVRDAEPVAPAPAQPKAARKAKAPRKMAAAGSAPPRR